MPRYEFKVIPAPRKGEKARGVKSVEDRFALALTMAMNEMGREGWDYVRSDSLPVDERVGFTGSKTTFQNMLVFRRVLPEEADMIGSFTAKLAEPAPAIGPRLGPADGPVGVAPSLGPAAKSDLAAE